MRSTIKQKIYPLDLPCLLYFSVSMGFFVYGFLYLSISYSTLLSPIIIGDGRSSFILEKKPNIKDFKNHKISYYKMGSDILCDIDLSIFSTKKKNQTRQ